MKRSFDSLKGVTIHRLITPASEVNPYSDFLQLPLHKLFILISYFGVRRSGNFSGFSLTLPALMASIL